MAASWAGLKHLSTTSVLEALHSAWHLVGELAQNEHGTGQGEGSRPVVWEGGQRVAQGFYVGQQWFISTGKGEGWSQGEIWTLSTV